MLLYTSRGYMRNKIPYVIVVTFGLASVSCGSPTASTPANQPDPPVIEPALESFDFESVGSGMLAFRRRFQSPAGSGASYYVLDAATHSTSKMPVPDGGWPL